MNVGIESISFFTSCYYLDLNEMAGERGVKPERFYDGIGQEKMAVSSPDEDIVTLGANAALQAIENVDIEKIDTLLFATESGIDQSKAAGIYVHRLLGLPSRCRVFEMKQACYSATGGLMLALPYVLSHPDRKVLIIASDIARYGLGAAGEPTQGAGAAAMVISAQPRIFEFDLESGMYTEDVMDFWRPNYRDEALVDGKYSVKIYLKALSESWKQYIELTGRTFDDFYRFAYHLPFSRMGETAHKQMAKTLSRGELAPDQVAAQVENSLIYNKIVGNTYTASVFIALMSMLENSEEDLSDKPMALFSYGSGCVGELFTGRVVPGYKKSLKTDLHRQMLDAREEVNLQKYKEFYLHQLPEDGSEYRTPQFRTGRFRLAGIKDHQRQYESVE